MSPISYLLHFWPQDKKISIHYPIQQHIQLMSVYTVLYCPICFYLFINHLPLYKLHYLCLFCLCFCKGVLSTTAISRDRGKTWSTIFVWYHLHRRYHFHRWASLDLSRSPLNALRSLQLQYLLVLCHNH